MPTVVRPGPIPFGSVARRIAAVAVALGCSSAFAAGGDYPRVGGHLGMAVPIVTFAEDTEAIGDFVTLAIAHGVNVRLAEDWSFDFEFVAYSDFEGDDNPVVLVVDPGVVYHHLPVGLGLRAAMATGGAETQNLGFIPIVNYAFDIDLVDIYIELDLPVFFREQGPDLTIQPQFGVAF